MAFDCENPCITCPTGISGVSGLAPSDPNNPYLNLTSEAPDVDNYIGRQWTRDDPPLGQTFYAVGCVGICVGRTQQEADECAARQVVLCESTNWPVLVVNPLYNPLRPGDEPPTIPTSRIVYGNTEQTCIKDCPDGTTASYTVPANTFYAFNQATADAIASSSACFEAQLILICMTELSENRICLDVEAELTFTANNAFGLCTFTVVDGSLPPGMAIENIEDNVASIYGTPTAGGTYTFTIECVDVGGEHGTKEFTLDVFGIATTTPLDSGSVSVPYSKALTIAGTPVGSYRWTVFLGSLPAGLTLNQNTGVISGTPTTAGSSLFVIQIQDDI